MTELNDQAASGETGEVLHLIEEAKRIARRYYQLTGRPLGISGEIAEHEASRLLGLKLAPVREAGIGAFLSSGEKVQRFQIKDRAVEPSRRYIGRVPKINLVPKFDAALLVLLEKNTFNVLEIWCAQYVDIKARLLVPGSKSRNERSSMGISQFNSIAQKIWPLVEPVA